VSVTIHGRNSNGWRMNWIRHAKDRWQFVVWPRDFHEDGQYRTEHPFWRPEKDRPAPHLERWLRSKDECEMAAEAFLEANQ
jgi:hypothetical protein